MSRPLKGFIWAVPLLWATLVAAPGRAGSSSEWQLALDANPRDADRIYRLGLQLTESKAESTLALPGSQAIATLAADPDWRLRRLAALLMGEFPALMDRKEPLAALLKDPNWRVRQQAMAALGAAPRPWAEQQLLAILSMQQPQYDTERRAAIVLAEAWGVAAVFVAGCRDRDGDVQLHSVWALDLWLAHEEGTARELTPAMRSAVRFVSRQGVLERARKAADALLASHDGFQGQKTKPRGEMKK